MFQYTTLPVTNASGNSGPDRDPQSLLRHDTDVALIETGLTTDL
jgi:hypothetical protein